MFKIQQPQSGFTLLELITIVIIVGVLAGSFASRLTSQDLLQLQASRDLVISAFFVAQREAMMQDHPVQISTDQDSIDIRVDENEDLRFTADESLLFSGTRYPLRLDNGVQLSNQKFVFNAYGHTAPGEVIIAKGARSVNLSISGTGYVY